MIYQPSGDFKAATFSATSGQQVANHVNYASGQFNYMSRSKTPTADMYYSTKSNGNAEYGAKYQNFSTSNMQTLPSNKHASKHMFENIYQPFNQPDDRELQEFNHYMDNNNFINVNTNNSNNSSGQNSACAMTKQSLSSDVEGNFYTEMLIDLYRQETGFGFRIMGGEEEGSQVSVGYIVNSGAAHIDGRLRPNDEIVMIDNECVLGATHRRVVQLMTIAGLNRKVKLRIRRKLTSQQYNKLLMKQQQIQQTSNLSATSNNTVTLFRNGNEGFGFVVISTINKTGPSIGKLVNGLYLDCLARNLHMLTGFFFISSL